MTPQSGRNGSQYRLTRRCTGVWILTSRIIQLLCILHTTSVQPNTSMRYIVVLSTASLMSRERRTSRRRNGSGSGYPDSRCLRRDPAVLLLHDARVQLRNLFSGTLLPRFSLYV